MPSVYLKRFLHLAYQKVEQEILWEVIVVDNASTDNTSEIAQKTWQELGNPALLKLVSEPNPGKSYAILKGVSTAAYEYIITCDDDNWLCETYLQSSFEIMNMNSNIGALGGQNEPVAEVELPNWFWTYNNYYAMGVPDLDSGDVTSKGELWGAGMVMRKSVFYSLLKAGFKNFTTCRKGKELSTGGDVEMCKWFILGGFKLWYDERLKLRHYIPAERISKNYIKELRKKNEEVAYLFTIYNYIISNRDNPRKAMKLIKFIIKLPFKLLSSKLSLTDKIMLSDLLYKAGISLSY